MQDRQLTKFFKLSELTHSDTAVARGIDNSPMPVHLHNLEIYTAPGLEIVRVVCGNLPINVHVAYRNPQVNKLVGGTPTSAHPEGLAADISIPGQTTLQTAKLIAAAMKPGGLLHGKVDQLILERTPATTVHVSFDPRARGQAGRQPGGPGTKIDWTFFK